MHCIASHKTIFLPLSSKKMLQWNNFVKIHWDWRPLAIYQSVTQIKCDSESYTNTIHKRKLFFYIFSWWREYTNTFPLMLHFEGPLKTKRKKIIENKVEVQDLWAVSSLLILLFEMATELHKSLTSPLPLKSKCYALSQMDVNHVKGNEISRVSIRSVDKEIHKHGAMWVVFQTGSKL